MTQSRGFHGRLHGPLLETELPLMKNVTKPLAKSVLIPLGLIAAASAADEAIQNEDKEQKGWFLSLLLGTLGTGLFGNILAGKGMNRAGEGFIRAGYLSSIKSKDF